MPYLDHFGRLARESLEASRPKLYRELQASGKLEAFLYQLQEQAKDVFAEAIGGGASHGQALELAHRQLALPSESEQPNLGESP
jgi:hypothetical protein